MLPAYHLRACAAYPSHAPSLTNPQGACCLHPFLLLPRIRHHHRLRTRRRRLRTRRRHHHARLHRTPRPRRRCCSSSWLAERDDERRAQVKSMSFLQNSTQMGRTRAGGEGGSSSARSNEMDRRKRFAHFDCFQIKLLCSLFLSLSLPLSVAAWKPGGRGYKEAHTIPVEQAGVCAGCGA